MKTQTLTRSFGSGVLAPELHGRTDLAQYQSGLKTCLNWIIKPSGSVTKRPGFEFGAALRMPATQPTGVRLFPFQTSDAEIIIVQTNQNYRFVKDNKYVLKARRAVSSITTMSVVTSGSHGFAGGEMIFIGAVDASNVQTAGDYWFVDSVTNATTFVVVPVFHTNTGDPSGAYVSEVYTVAEVLTASLLPKIHYAQNGSTITFTSGSQTIRELTRVADNDWTLATASFAAQIDPPVEGQPFGIGTYPAASSLTCGAVAFPHVYSGHSTVISTSLADTCRYKITSLSVDGEESIAGTDALSSVASATTSANLLYATKANPAVFTTFGVHGLSAGNVVVITTPVPIVGAGESGAGTSWTTLNNTVWKITATPTTSSFTLEDANSAVPLSTTSFKTPYSNFLYPGTVGLESALGYRITAVTLATIGVFTTGAVHGLIAGDVVILGDMPTGTGGGTAWTTLTGVRYRVASVPTTTTFTLSEELTGVVLDTSGFKTYTSGGTHFLVGTRVDLSIADSRVAVAFKPSLDPNVERYNVYKQNNSTGAYGFAGTIDPTTGINAGVLDRIVFLDDNIVPDVTRQPPEEWDAFPSGTTYQPAAVAYHEQRRVFAGSETDPQRVWLTPTGFPSSMNQHFPILDSDAFDFRIFSKRTQRIKHLVSLGELLALNSNSIHSISFNGIIPSAPAISFIGASDTPPVECEGSVVFISNGDERAHEIEYAQDGSGRYIAVDISVFATHLFDDHTIVSLAHCRGTTPTLWAVRDDGLLLSCTYRPSQEVRAWHTHTTDGTPLSVTSVNESGVDRLYVAVSRVIDGVTYMLIERMAPLKLPSQSEALFLDSATSAYNATPALTATGLWHLEGETVNALADGVVVRDLVVDGGTVTFPVAAAHRVIGRPYVADIETLPLSLQVAGGGMGRDRNVDRVSLRVYETSGLQVGPDFSNLVEPKPEVAETYSTPPALTTGELTVPIETYSDNDSTFCVRSSDPLPATISALALRLSVSG